MGALCSTSWWPGRPLHLLAAGILVWLGGALAQERADRAGAGPVAVLDMQGAIGPASADYFARGLERAVDEGASLVVLRMDTPGGLADSMRRIIQDILAAPIPVATFVAPRGSRAASAGTYILYASHVAAMAPGTNLGAATPVQIGGMPGQPQPQEQPADGEDGEEGEPAARQAGMEEKIVNDSAAYIRSLAQLRERNAEWAEKAVREAASLSASEALDMRVIDLVAQDIDDLLAKLDGRTVDIGGQTLTLQTAEAATIRIEPDWRTELLAILTNPNVAYILMLVGIYGIIFEFYSPGLVFPGVVGAISLLMALYAFQVLPVNYAGLALIGVGIALMIGEMMVPSFGALGIGGIAAFVLGSILLMDTDLPGFQIAWQLVGGIALTASLLLLLLIVMLNRSRQRKVETGQEEMVGSPAKVLRWDGTAGHVHVHGESWQARGPAGLAPGQQVRITAIHGLTLEVETDS